VGHKQVVAYNPGLTSTVTNGRLAAVRGVAGSEVARVVAQDGRAPRLVEGDPVLALGDGLEHDTGIVLKIEGELCPVQQTAVTLVESIGEIPVVEGDEGSDAGLEEVVDELDIVVNTLLVDGIVAATEGDDSGPREGEAVASDAQRLEEIDILLGTVIRVASYGAGAAIGDLAGNLAEGIPDGRATAISLGRAFDLVGSGSKAPVEVSGKSHDEAGNDVIRHKRRNGLLNLVEHKHTRDRRLGVQPSLEFREGKGRKEDRMGRMMKEENTKQMGAGKAVRGGEEAILYFICLLLSEGGNSLFTIACEFMPGH